MLRSDATKQGGGHAPEYPQLVACEGELATLQVNHFVAERLDQVEVEQVGGCGVGRLSDTNTAKGRPLQVNTFLESVLP